MRVLIAAVGRLRSGPALALFEEYRQRLTWPLTVREVEERKPLPAARMMAREAALLLAVLPRQAASRRLVALDWRGRALSSEGFAARLGGWRDEGVGEVAFLIGGADGHGNAVRERADLLLSLGPMTWPHLLVRGLLAEQLYRAQQILAGHPYHRA